MQKANNGEVPNDLMIDGTTVSQLRRKLFRFQASFSSFVFKCYPNVNNYLRKVSNDKRFEEYNENMSLCLAFQSQIIHFWNQEIS